MEVDHASSNKFHHCAASYSFICPSGTQTVISYASFNERTAGALLVAEDQGFFRKQDLDARLVYVRAGNVALSALAAGESQFYFGSGTGVTLGAVAGAWTVYSLPAWSIGLPVLSSFIRRSKLPHS